jgi:hypothetical protein
MVMCISGSPSTKSVFRLRQKVADLLVRQNAALWTNVRDRRNGVGRDYPEVPVCDRCSWDL